MVIWEPICTSARTPWWPSTRAGRKLAETTVPASPAATSRCCAGRRRWPERRWALEDCRHLSRRLERDLLRAGEAVVRVPPKLMAGARRSSARSRARATPSTPSRWPARPLREPDLPVATLDGPERELRLLVDHREDLVAERTRDHAAACAGTSTSWRPASRRSASLDRRIVLARLADALAAPSGARRAASPASSSAGSAS